VFFFLFFFFERNWIHESILILSHGKIGIPSWIQNAELRWDTLYIRDPRDPRILEAYEEAIMRDDADIRIAEKISLLLKGKEHREKMMIKTGEKNSEIQKSLERKNETERNASTYMNTETYSNKIFFTLPSSPDW
jgi:hypothetical protein